MEVCLVRAGLPQNVPKNSRQLSRKSVDESGKGWIRQVEIFDIPYHAAFGGDSGGELRTYASFQRVRPYEEGEKILPQNRTANNHKQHKV